jgi:large subunit ribosomal protein L22
MEFTAQAKYVRVSPQKARLVLDLIKGRRVEDALNVLAFTKKGIAPDVEKLLRSALENANYLSQEKGIDVDVDRLFVKNAIANEGPRMKRIRPAPMGRAYRYQRRMTHMHIALEEKSFATNGAGGATAETVAAAASAKKKAPQKKKAVAKKAPAKKSAKKKK